MKLQKWIVSREIDGEDKIDIGEVLTSMSGTETQAWDKAAHKYNLGKPYTIGWSLTARRDKIVDREVLK